MGDEAKAEKRGSEPFDRFLIAPGHEIDRIDRVVERHPDHVVIVKREGKARAMAAAPGQRPR
jgi:hypothetical protein